MAFETHHDIPCCMQGVYDVCVCSHEERVLRYYAYSEYKRPMTMTEREWCIDEADHAGEGYYSANELTELNDQELSEAVIRAWSMYVASM